VLYALGLVDTGYRFGGKNPDAGLDCSGMVSHIYQSTLGLKVKGSAADIARQARAIERQDLRPGDLVFFNTNNRSFSHVGIYIGDARFVMRPRQRPCRIDRLGDRYYAQRLRRRGLSSTDFSSGSAPSLCYRRADHQILGRCRGGQALFKSSVPTSRSFRSNSCEITAPE
jgi:hypothetical protein